MREMVGIILNFTFQKLRFSAILRCEKCCFHRGQSCWGPEIHE